MPDLPDVLVPARFCGPPSSGNGGWSAGAIAAYRRPTRAPERPRPALAGGRGLAARLPRRSTCRCP